MCQLTKKLALFNYMIDKWTEQQARKDDPTIEKGQDVSLEKKKATIQKFSTTRFMKLAYFTCLESARIESQKETGINIDNTLFKYLDNWIAYSNGPVEQTIYNHKEQMLTVAKNENFQYRPGIAIEKLTNQILQEGLFKYQEMIDNSIENLTNDGGKSIPFDADDDIGKLIWLSHGELWNIAQWTNDKKLFVDEAYFLIKELNKFDERKKHLMVNYQLVS
jgi:hypothetical protein